MTNLETSIHQYDLLNHLPNGICIISKDWTINYWNNTLQEWTGLSKELVEGTQLGSTFPHLAKPQYFSRLNPLFRGGPPATFAPQFHSQFFPALLPGGPPRILHTIARAIRSREADCWDILIVVQDVSNLHRQVQQSEKLRKQANKEVEIRTQGEIALRESEERFKLAIKGTNDGIWDWPNVNEDEEWWSPQFYRLLGYEPNEIMASHTQFQAFLHPGDHPITLDTLENHLKENQPFNLEYRLRTKSGKYRWFHGQAHTERDDTGTPLRMVGSIQDITKRKQNEQMLEAILDAETTFLTQQNTAQTFEKLLQQALTLTESEYGFIGEILQRQSGQPYLKTHSITNIAWNQETRDLYDKLAPNFEFDNLQTLFGTVISSGQPIIANDPQHDPQRGGLPLGHPPLNAFLGLPIYYGTELVGMVGVANRPGGYDEETVKFFQHFLTTCGRLINANRIENQRHKAEEKFRLVVEASPSGMIMIDGSGTIVLANAMMCEQFGYARDTLLGLSIETLIPERFRPQHPDHRTKFFTAPEPRTMGSGRNLYGLRQDGTEFPVEIGLNPLTTDEGTFVLASVVDITARKKAEEKFRLVVEAAPSGMIMIDQEGKIVLVNQLIETMFGFARNELLEQPIEILLPTRFRRHHVTYRIGFFANPKSRKMRSGASLTGLRKDGTEIPVEIGLNPLQTEDGIFVLAAITDISERREVEEQMTIVSQELERNNKELSEARDTALEAAKAKSEFLATMSHEIRTPMNGVIGMTSLLLDTSLTDEQHDLAETVKHSGELLLDLINDILDFSKNEAGKLELEIIEFELRTAVEEVLELLAERASNKGLELIGLVYATTPVSLKGDPGRIRQVLMNLIGNAIKFTETGEIVLQVSVQEEQDEEITLRFAVTDTGIGLSEEAQGRLFQSFSQADSSTTRKYGGTGLGLAICKQIVTCMRGDIGITSTVGEGSEFWFTVPLLRGENQPSPSQVHTNLQGVHACLVESNDTVRFLIHHYAQIWGMECTVAANGADALQLIKTAALNNTPCDLIIVDQQLPDMSGVKFAQVVKSDPALAHSRLIMLSSFAQRGEARMAHDAGFMAYLTKPVRQEHLYRCLTTALSSSQTTMDGQERTPTLITRHTLEETEKRSRTRILLAEDNIVNQKVASKMLDKLGYRVDVVANGREATEAVSRMAYDAILMDCQMPEMDGHQATQNIRRREAANEKEDRSMRVPIIALTANAMKGDRERCLESGMDDFLSKPINIEQLEETLERWIPQERFSQQNTQEINPMKHESPQTHTQEDNLTAPLNMQILDELKALGGDDDPNFLASVIDQFVEDIPRHLEGIRQAIETQDADHLMKAAHGFKGSSRNMGADLLADVCFALEELGRNGSTENTTELLANLKQEEARVRKALQEVHQHTSVSSQ